MTSKNAVKVRSVKIGDAKLLSLTPTISSHFPAADMGLLSQIERLDTLQKRFLLFSFLQHAKSASRQVQDMSQGRTRHAATNTRQASQNGHVPYSMIPSFRLD